MPWSESCGITQQLRTPCSGPGNVERISRYISVQAVFMSFPPSRRSLAARSSGEPCLPQFSHKINGAPSKDEAEHSRASRDGGFLRCEQDEQRSRTVLSTLRSHAQLSVSRRDRPSDHRAASDRVPCHHPRYDGTLYKVLPASGVISHRERALPISRRI